MKILHVITSLRTGGAEKLMVDLLPRLRDLGNEVELCVFDGVRTPFFEQLEECGIKIHSFGVDTNVYHPKHIFHLANLMKNYDIIHTHNTAPQLFAALAHICVRKPRLITTEHNTTNRRRGKWYLKWGDCWMYRQYKKIICISDQAQENLVSYLGQSVNTDTIYNGIELKKYTEAEPLRVHDNNTKVITMVSAFREQKDHKTLIRAFNTLPEYYFLQFAGDGELREETEAYALQLPCSDRITFLGNRNDVPALLKGSDAVILSSHYEGLSLSSLEGMASGRPFIASDVDGLHEIVNGYGILFPHEDADALAAAIKRACEDSEYAAQIAKRCVERAMQFDISVMAEKYNQVYLNCSE